jgi:hypothetical protein
MSSIMYPLKYGNSPLSVANGVRPKRVLVRQSSREAQEASVAAAKAAAAAKVAALQAGNVARTIEQAAVVAQQSAKEAEEAELAAIQGELEDENTREPQIYPENYNFNSEYENDENVFREPQIYPEDYRFDPEYENDENASHEIKINPLSPLGVMSPMPPRVGRGFRGALSKQPLMPLQSTAYPTNFILPGSVSQGGRRSRRMRKKGNRKTRRRPSRGKKTRRSRR